ncbi:MAG: hypothetical protein WCS76_01710, partial [Bacilli bacterium]
QIEGKNFDIRKNLLDYDDVIAKQRAAIYEKRDSILFSENINDLIYDFFQTTGLFLAKKALSPETRDGTISGDSLRKIVEPRYMAEGTFRANAYDEAPAEEAGQDLGDTLYDRYIAKRKEWGEEIANQVERQIALQTIDQNWTRHIDTMSRLREGIYLRSYANTNPLQDYVNEGHALFRDMLDKVSADVCLKLLNAIVQIKKPEEAPKNDDKVIDATEKPVQEKE